MENKNPIIENIFPTPICRIKIPKHFTSIIPCLERFAHLNPSDANQTYGSRSKNSYILEDKDLIEFKNYILSQVSNYATQILNLSNQTYKITQSWISYKHPNQHHHAHTHPNSIISGVFFWENPFNSHSQISFTKITSNNTWSLLPNNSNKNIYNPNFTNQVSFTPEPGNLILFPSYLPHEVSINKTSSIRKSMSFNTIPLVLGNEIELTELKFN